jgi:hypothetical protein
VTLCSCRLKAIRFKRFRVFGSSSLGVGETSSTGDFDDAVTTTVDAKCYDDGEKSVVVCGADLTNRAEANLIWRISNIVAYTTASSSG